MKSKITPSSGVTVGIDLGDKKHAICVLNREGEIVDERTITNHRESFRRLSKKYPEALMVMEVGSHSPWLSRFLEGLNHRVLVANPRKVRAIYQNTRKSDERDARMLAKIARMDESLLFPIQHGSAEAQRDLLQIRLRDNIAIQSNSKCQTICRISCCRGILGCNSQCQTICNSQQFTVSDDLQD
jgi:transposase